MSNSKTLMKIVNCQIKSSYLLNNFRNFNVFRKKCVFKSKKEDFTFFLKNTVLEKPQVGVKLTSSFFMVEIERKLVDFRYFDANLC